MNEEIQTPAGFLAMLQSSYFVMEPTRLSVFLRSLSARVKANTYTAAAPGSGTTAKYTVRNGIAHIAIKGILIRQVPKVFRWFGIEATAYEDIARQVRDAINDNQVKSIQLDVDSPGGLVTGILETADTIRAAREYKTIIAVVDDLAASGAYWLASQANKIIIGPNGQAGSIGVYTVYIDTSKAADDIGLKVHVIKSGPHKGTGVPSAPITAEQLEPIQDIIDGLAANFINSVSKGRRVPAKDVRAWATGEMWLADKARTLGLVDEITKSISLSTSSNNNQTFQKENKKMVNTITQSKQTEENNLVEQLIRKQVKKNMLADWAEFKSNFDDVQFAWKAFSAGMTLEEAKDKYCEVIKERESTLKYKGQAYAVEPDFMEQARELAAKENSTLTAAMKKLAKSKPELHKAFIRKSN